MSIGNNRWFINGTPVVRNPDAIDIKYDKSNATYTQMANGDQRRIDVPTLISAATLELGWKNSDVRTRQFYASLLNSKSLNIIEVGGLLPRRAFYAYADTPQSTASIDGFDLRPGQSGWRYDYKMTLRTDGPYMHSINTVPYGTPDPNYINAAFGGPTGVQNIDALPVWSGHAWNGTLATGTQVVTISNLGTAQWSPLVRMNGPFTTVSMKALYEDVDGTGGGVQFTWAGANLNSGDYIIFDTQRQRCYLTQGGVTNEVYSFSVQAVATNTPFPYFPPLMPGDSQMTFIVVGGGTGASYDFSNVGTATFNYRNN